MGNKVLRWNVTDHCNFNCSYCAYPLEHRAVHPTGELRTDEIEATVEKLARGGVKEVMFLGGEPTTRKDLPNIIRLLQDKGIQSGIVTNGSLLTDDLINRLVDAGLSKANVSLDGSTAATNNITKRAKSARFQACGLYDRILTSLRTLANTGRVHVNINTVVTKSNAADVANMVDLAADFGVHMVTFLREIAHRNDPRPFGDFLTPQEHLNLAIAINTRAIARRGSTEVSCKFLRPLAIDSLKRDVKDLAITGFDEPCSAGILTGILLSDGRLVPCELFSSAFPTVLRYFGFDESDTNLRDHSLLEVWNGPLFRRAFETVTSDMLWHYKPCGRCPHLAKDCTPCPPKEIVTGTWIGDDICAAVAGDVLPQSGSIWTPADGIRWNSSSSETVVFNPSAGESFSLTGDTAFLWSLVVRGFSDTEIAAFLKEEHPDLDFTEVLAQVHEFTEASAAAGLVKNEA